MRAGIAALVAAYVLSQFYRSFLAVLAPALARDIGATPADLSLASGLWFAVFAAMQLPVGWALDTLGPRRTAASLFLLGGAGGAAVFALAGAVWQIHAAMILIGIGCSPVLMASFFIFARVYRAAVFATLAGAMIGFGSFGNIAGSAPMAWAVEAFGWRGTMAGLSVATALVAALLFAIVRDPPAPDGAGAQQGSVLDLLKMPAVWALLPLMAMNYAPAAGIRGVWAGPYLAEVFGADAAVIGWATLAMALAMVAGNFAYGPLDRLFGTRKWVVLTGNLVAAAACLALWAMPDRSLVFAAAMMAAIGLFGASFPVIVAHGRAFFPAHLTGRGVTLMNLFGIGGVGLFQMISSAIYSGTSPAATTPAAPYALIFLVFGVAVLIGCLIYAFSTDRTD